MIKVSEKAKTKIIQLMEEDGFNLSSSFVRVGVKSGGCSGLSYDLKFDDLEQEGDKVFEDNGVKVVVDKKSFLYLVGTTLEYSNWFKWYWFCIQQPKCQQDLWVW